MNYLKYILYFFPIALMAQQTPAPNQSKPIAIQGGTLHIGDGTVIENGWLFFEKGKFTTITDANGGTTSNLEGYDVIDARGKDIYPGFIVPNSQLGLTEIGAVNATNDNRELGYLNPSLRSIIAYNTDSRVTPTVRSNGILLAQIMPQGGRISGQSTIVELDAWNWEDAAYKMDEGIVLNWPSRYSWTGWQTGNPRLEKNKKYNELLQELEDYLKEAQAYAKNKTPKEQNLKFEAMRGLFDGSKQLYVKTGLAKNIMEAVLLCEKFDIQPVIVGGKEAWRIADFLLEHNIALILDATQSLPDLEDDDIDQPFKNPNILSEKGVLYCFSLNGSWGQRNLPFQAGQAVGYGLDYEKAVMGLTLNTAKILKIDDSLGSLTVGKDATFFISEGDALDMRTNKVTQAFIRGKAIDLDNKQKALYRKYAKRYGQ